MDLLHHFREIWCVDFEFHASDGHRPQPHCVVAREMRSGQLVSPVAGGWGRGSTLPAGGGFPLRRVLCERGNRLPSGVELGCPASHPRPVRRVPKPHERVADPAR